MSKPIHAYKVFSFRRRSLSLSQIMNCVVCRAYRDLWLNAKAENWLCGNVAPPKWFPSCRSLILLVCVYLLLAANYSTVPSNAAVNVR